MAEQAAADGARADADGMRRRIGLDADQSVRGAIAAQAQWQQLAETRKAAEAAASRSRRAYALGEAGIADLNAAQRQAQEVALAELDTRAAAVGAWLRIEVDSHALWHVHGNEDAPTAGDRGASASANLPGIPAGSYALRAANLPTLPGTD